MNHLFYGDNLLVLREQIKSDSVDLVYLDPPFNSQATYNVLFRSPSGSQSQAQIEAFEDTWHWNEHTERAFDEVLSSGNGDVAEMLRSFRSFLKENDMMAYLTMMAVRLLELHRVLKPTGSLYLHCDPTASHYLKVLLDSVFGADRFLNEVVWQRTGAHNDAKRFGRVTDTLLFYSKTSNYVFNPQYAAYSPEYIAERYRYKDPDGRIFWPNTATSPNPRPNMMYEWKGCPSPPNGWRFELKTMERLEKENRLYYSKTGMVYVKNYLDEQKGRAPQNLWGDITMSKSGAERLGYPTQKPVELLERIVSTSSNPGDVVLDRFCGCGTTIHAAQKLERQWIGIDVTHLAISLIEKRLKDAFPGIQFAVHGTPKDLDGAHELAERDKYQFQWWAVSLVDAVPYGGKKKGADSGIDGFIYFKPDGKTTEKAIISVKGGLNVGVPMIRDLGHVVEREKAKVGVFITLAEPTKPMLTEAVKAGFYETPYGKFPKLQIFTIKDLFEGRRPHLPWLDTASFRKAATEDTTKQHALFDK